MPFTVPDRYFNELDEKIMEIIRSHPDYQTSREELESVSPLLSSISKRPVYSVPKGYFENFKPGVEEKRRQRLFQLQAGNGSGMPLRQLSLV